MARSRKIMESSDSRKAFSMVFVADPLSRFLSFFERLQRVVEMETQRDCDLHNAIQARDPVSRKSQDEQGNCNETLWSERRWFSWRYGYPYKIILRITLLQLYTSAAAELYKYSTSH